MNNVLIYPRGQLTELDRARLEEAGIVAVEADDPEKVVTTLPTTSLASADDLFLAALTAVANGNEGQRFADALWERLQRRERESAGAQP